MYTYTYATLCAFKMGYDMNFTPGSLERVLVTKRISFCSSVSLPASPYT